MNRTRRSSIATATSIATVLFLGAASIAACGSESSDGAKGEVTQPTAKLRTLNVLITNDDGYSAAGIDALVEGVSSIPSVKVTVVAPLTNQSGTSDKTTAGALSATEVKTTSGFPATAVAGYPADSVNYALDILKLSPQLVVSGSNAGQNIGVVAPISGTVGAGRTAARRGIPALAVSQGFSATYDYSSGVKYAVEWIERNQVALSTPTPRPSQSLVVSINSPSCIKGQVRGIVAVPLSTTGNGIGDVDCTSTEPAGADDSSAFLVGFATITTLTEATQTVTSTTSWPT